MFRVGIIGPESTGKSSLGQYLAKRYGATYVPEYARDYVAALRRPYTYEDVCHIARKQIEQIRQGDAVGSVIPIFREPHQRGAENSVLPNIEVRQRSSRTGKRSDNEVVRQRSGRTTKWSDSNVVFFDTELIVTRVWFDYVYGATPDWLLSAMQQYKMDAYLLTYPDIPWIPDPTRENGSDEMRLQLFHRYEQEIQTLDVPYYIIRHTDNSEHSEYSE